MKKSILLFPVFAFFAFTLSAQQLWFGARAGYTLSDVLIKVPSGSDEVEDPFSQLNDMNRTLGSAHLGLDARLPIGQRWGILASLLYARKGYIGKMYWPSGPADAIWQLHYLNLPIVVDFRLWKGLSLQAGAEAGWLLKTRVKSGSEAFNPDNGLIAINDFDFGLVGGLEYSFGNGIFIGARHTYGVAHLQKFEVTDDFGASLGEVKSRNSATQFSAGYRYYFGQ